MPTDHRIQFEKLEWEYLREGVAQKIHLRGANRMRLLRFSAGFIEDEWCTKGHVGYVLKGSMRIDFNDASE